MADMNCPTCKGIIWSKELHHCYFAQHVPYDGSEPFRHLWEETSMTLTYAQVVGHAVFCVAKYDEEVGDEVRLNASTLSNLLNELLEETERRLHRFYLATQDQTSEQTQRKEG